MAQAIFVQGGETIDYTPSADTPAGTVVVQGDLVGVTNLDLAANILGALTVYGVFDFAKAISGGSALAAGTSVYWDNTAKVATATASGNKLIGKVVRAAVDADATVRVRLMQ